jgi:riboflavin kinase / FMN adenylyltransferase
MKIIDALTSPALPPSVVTVGCFDGVHRGHRQLLNDVRRIGLEKGLPTALLTFDPIPRAVISPETAPPLICSLRTRLRLLEETRCVDYCCVLTFDKAMKDRSADEFIIEILVRWLSMCVLVVGQNFACGRGRAGDVAHLTGLGKRYNFCVRAQPLHAPSGMNRCSSTELRRLILLGKLSEAVRLLDRPYEVTGAVVENAGPERKNVIRVALDTNLCAPPEDEYLGAIRKSGPDYWRKAILTICDRAPQGDRIVQLAMIDDLRATVGEAVRMRFDQRAMSDSPYLR